MATYSTLYVNSTSFATATAVFTDPTLSTLAADGYYSDGNIVRRQLNGILQPAGNCGSCTPTATACSGSISGSGGQGIYLLTVDLGETVSDVGAVIIEFDVYSIPDGIRATYDGVIYNTLSSPTYGPLKGETDDFTFVGDSGLWCSPDPRNTTITLDEYEYNGSSFTLTGGTQDIFIDPNSDETTASSPGTCKMVVPKPNQTPATLLIESIGPCPTAFNVSVNCPAALTSFSSSTNSVDKDTACGKALDQTYYSVPVSGTAGSPEVNDFVYEDEDAVTPLSSGWYNTASGVLEVDSNGVVISEEFCDMIMTVKTDNTGTTVSGTDQFKLPLTDDAATSNVDVYITGGALIASGLTSSSNTITFPGGAGTYSISLRGTIGGIKFQNGGDASKLISVTQAGIWGNLGSTGSPYQFAFWGCDNLTSLDVSDTLYLSGNLSRFLSGCSSLTSIGTNWDTSAATSMASMFLGCSSFNGAVSHFDTSSVTNINSMFRDCSSFNQNVSLWDVSSVTQMNATFEDATSFNTNITSSWATQNVTNMARMFKGATSWNGSGYAGWDVSSVTDFSQMFEGATSLEFEPNGWALTLGPGRAGGVPDMSNMLDNTAITSSSYGNLLNDYESNNVIDGVTIGVLNLEYQLGTAAETSRDDLINNHSWTFVGDSGV